VERVKSWGAVAALALAPTFVNAATIDLAAAGFETNGTSATIALSAGGGEGVTVSFGSLLAFDGVTFSSFDSFDVATPADYALAFDADGFLTDTVDATGADETYVATGIVEALFTSITAGGIFAGSDAVLVSLTSSSGLVSDGFGSLIDTTEQSGSLTVEGLSTLTPVPLPAGFPMLLAGLAAFGVMRRSQRA